MPRSRGLFALTLVAVLAPLTAAQPPPDGVVSPEGRELRAAVSLTDRDLTYGHVARGEEGSAERMLSGRVMRDEVFGWHDGSIRLTGRIDTAGGCAVPTGMTARLVERSVRIEFEQPAICPAVWTAHRFFARVWGLRPGRYEVRVYGARGLALPIPPDGVEVPGPGDPRF